MPDADRGRAWHVAARSVLTRSLGLRRGQTLLIETFAHTLGVADVLAEEARNLGVRPIVLYAPGSLFAPARGVPPDHLYAITRVESAAAQTCDAFIHLPPSPADLDRRDRMPPAYRRAFEARRHEWHRLLVRHLVPSVDFLAAGATEESARRFQVRPGDWEKESLRASSVPPALIRKEGLPLLRRLEAARRVTVSHPNGTRLELGLLGRAPYLDDGAISREDLAHGRVGTTVPGGYLAVALHERVANGRFVSNRPSRYRSGIVGGLSWTFRGGRVTHFDAARGRDLVAASYRKAGPERVRPALLEIGLNPEVHDFPLAEDLERGVVTLYIGHNDDFGGRTRGTYRQYALLRGADLSLDDTLVLKGGERVV